MGSLPDAVGSRLDVRLNGGRAVSYALAGEFLVGSAAGCDLRLPGPDLPPVVCQFLQERDSVRVRRLAEAPLLLNDKPIAQNSATDLHDGDVLSLGPVQITLANATSALLHPKLMPIEVLASEDDFELRQNALDEQARELEEDRRLWYARRQEMEAELQRMRAEVASRGHQQNGSFAEREAELKRHRSELDIARQSLNEDYESKRGELSRMLESVHRDAADLAHQKRDLELELKQRRMEADNEIDARRQAFESELNRKRLEIEDDLREHEPRLAQLKREREHLSAERRGLDIERQSIQELRDDLVRERNGLDVERQWQIERIEKLESDLAGREADLACREEQFNNAKSTHDSTRDSYKDDLLRLDRWQAALELKQAALETRAGEIDDRFAQMRRDAADLEEQVQLSHAENDRLRGEGERLDRLKAEVASQSAKFAERSAQVEAQQAMLAMLRAKLDRQKAEIQSEADALAGEKQKQEALRTELDEKLRDSEMLRAELGFLRDDHESKHRAVQEQQSLFETTLDEFRRQKEELQSKEAALKEREDALEAQAAETADQAATLKAKLLQSLDLQQRLEADRIALRDREAAMAEAEAARQALQEQLRKRAEELSGRGRTLDLTAREVAEEKNHLLSDRATIDEWRAQAEAGIAASQLDLNERAAELERQTAGIVEREAAMARQVARMKEVGNALAAERKSLFEVKQAWEVESSSRQQQKLAAAHEIEELRRQAPDLESRAAAALEKLNGAKETLRNHLSELHEFARNSREALLVENEQLRHREQAFDQARAEHLQSVAAFRQQMLDWKAKVAEVRQAMNQNETRVGDRQTDLETAARRLEQSQRELNRREVELLEEQRVANGKRNEMERHLADMREWYRRKLRDLAAGRSIDDADMPAWETGETPVIPLAAQSANHNSPSESDPADQQLGDLLLRRGLVDDAAMQALWNESRRQRKSLRQTLLSSGVLTVYQLALIEAGKFDGLVMDRFRVFDRVRTTPREYAYRVFDPSRPNVPTVLRVLQDGDEVHREEYRQRFAAAAQAQHANLVNVLEVLEIQDRPAVLLEAVSGTPSSDWPPLVATPGIWLKLLTDAAVAIACAHSARLVHGRLAPDSFLLTANGTLKVTGLGEPAWLTGTAAIFESRPAADLRALGRVAYGWSQIGAKRCTNKSKPFPAELAAIVRRLETGTEIAMDDIIALERPYADATELIAELEGLRETYPCPEDAWAKLLRSITDEDEIPLRQTA